jgi:hypothetical protein
MPDDAGKTPPEPAVCPSPRFHVPDFMLPKSIAEVRELARLIALAEWAPDSYRDLDGEYIQQKIELAIMHGATVGLGPIAAVQSIAVIDGMPTIWGDGALSIVERSGLLEDMVEEYQLDPEEGLTAVCTMRRRRRPTPITNRFSMGMAEHARLTRKEGPWQTYPQRMLKMRARSWTIRDGFADVLRGLHIREEVDDFHKVGGHSVSRPKRAEDISRGISRPRRTRLKPESHVDAPSVIENQDQPGGGTTREESFTLVDAEGGFIEVIGGDALLSTFERIFSKEHLSADQILGLWESNDCARDAIERLFGSEALVPATERVRSVQAEREQPVKENEVGTIQPPDRTKKEQKLEIVGNQSDRYESSQTQAENRAAAQPDFTDANLILQIDPTWGDQKVFRHYWAKLAALRKDGSTDSRDIMRFREANSVIEARLRAKLPQVMNEIDAFFFGRSR